MASTRNEVKRLVAGYPGAEITDETVLVFVSRLSKLPQHEVAAVIDWCHDHRPFFPSLPEFMAVHRELFGAVPERLDGSLYGRFAELHGRPRTAEQDDEYAGVCRRLGVGWVASENPTSQALEAVSA